MQSDVNPRPPGTPIVSSCPCCGSNRLADFYEVRDIPIHSCILTATRDEALAFPRRDRKLANCAECGFVANVLFDAASMRYGAHYEDQQVFSSTFNAFARELARKLVDRYDLRGKRIVEIGCGKADFLSLLCDLGGNCGTGIDPAVVPERLSPRHAGSVTLLREPYGETHIALDADFICCRHTLEHIPDPAVFVDTMRRAIGERTDVHVLIEVPDATRVLDGAAFEDIYYEHCSYFTPGSLGRLLRDGGFEIVDLYRAYGDQYLLIEARPVDVKSTRVHALEETPAQVNDMVRRFVDRVHGRRQQWLQRIAHADQRRLAIWGSGSKCVSFVTTLRCVDRVGCIVDVNPHRHGRFIPGIGTAVSPPETLVEIRPQQVLVMNRLYRDEIAGQIDGMGLTCELICL